MTKQEEIREEVSKLLPEIFWDGYNKWYETGKDYPFLKKADAILSYLHSQGVVIKVEGELPEEPKGSGMREQFEDILSGYRTAQMEMLKAGYVAVEPLIKEKK